LALKQTPQPTTHRQAIPALSILGLVGVVVAALCNPAFAADPVAGRSTFAGECSLCHSAEPGDNGGGMGPALHGLIGQPAAVTDKTYPYSQGLRDAKIVWDAAALDRYLADPSKTAPGTTMTLRTADKAARDNLIAYLVSLMPTAPRQ
jgi:cytochrome c